MIIALTARSQAGKDTVCEIIQEMWDDTQRIAFADNVKKFTALALDITLEELEFLKNSKEEWTLFHRGITTRQLLQRVGTEAGRGLFGENVWVDLALKDIDPKKIYVITDCRFENEAKKVKELGGIVVKIWRKEADNVPSTHASETADLSAYYDYQIHNDGTKQELRETIEGLLETIALDWIG